MKHSRGLIIRLVAGATVATMLAACGAGSESSNSTERTRNVLFWTATTSPTKMLIYGTQDGYVRSIYVPQMSGSVGPEDIVTLSPLSSGGWANAVASVAVDTARSEIVVLAEDTSAGTQLLKYSLDGTGRAVLYEKASTHPLGMGYDAGSRIAAFVRSDGGTMRYIVQSVDDAGTTINDTDQPFYAMPSYDGETMLITTNRFVRKVDLLDLRNIYSSSGDGGLPGDIWTIAKSPTSETIYAGRSSAGIVASTDLLGSTGFSSIKAITSPVALAVFSDGDVVVGTGGAPASGAVIGDITIIDPTGTNPMVEIDGANTEVAASGIQSVWAIESPIAELGPTVTQDESGLLNCSDAQWRSDLPLSRLSRAPIASVRTYAWFKDGVQVEGALSESYTPTEIGDYTCGVIASNFAGEGMSPKSESFSVSAIPTTTTTGTSSGSDVGSASSPVVTVPAVVAETPVVIATPALRSTKWTFRGRTVKVTFRKWSGASKYRMVITGATKKTITCKTSKSTVTCTTVSLKKGINAFSARALSRTSITLAQSTKTKLTK